jgi:hypothetical protein
MTLIGGAGPVLAVALPVGVLGFVVDHAPCATLLVRPVPAPEVATIPRPPD